jgi:hypothetical protein
VLPQSLRRTPVQAIAPLLGVTFKQPAALLIVESVCVDPVPQPVTPTHLHPVGSEQLRSDSRRKATPIDRDELLMVRIRGDAQAPQTLFVQRGDSLADNLLIGRPEGVGLDLLEGDETFSAGPLT